MKLGELGKEPSTCFPACGPNLAHFYLRRYERGGGKRIYRHLSNLQSANSGAWILSEWRTIRP
jgi:hypothetical protein